ncbi:hypothetical protein EVAR_69692_1 [Eumeta japonica]|uniref:RNase H type-1 domain-containing protein n=1 Tax=Eumeta variegata TaxID=151549 RepID=A0A4C2A3V9_EUMVA|nr:hypothetical protein EVAR_69692_1 [Eumeta japonica]
MKFLWVPSHSKIQGNEVMGKLLKIQTPIINDALNPAPSVPMTEYYSKIKMRMFDSWSRDWEYTRQYKGKWYAVQKNIAVKPWYFKLASTTRKFITPISRDLATGSLQLILKG